MTSEMTALAETFGYGWADLQWFTVNAMKSAFIGFDERLALINDVIKPGYAALHGLTDVAHGRGAQCVAQRAPCRSSTSSRQRAASSSNGGLGARRVGSGRIDERHQPAQRLGLGERVARLVVARPVADVEQQLGGEVQLRGVDGRGCPPRCRRSSPVRT